MKTYVITISKTFPKGHIIEGHQTGFKAKILRGLGCPDKPDCLCDIGCFRQHLDSKIHTIRANFPLWEKRIAEVQCGKACLDIRQWSGQPYRSKQEKIIRLTAADGVGIQRLKLDAAPYAVRIDDRIIFDVDILSQLAYNDGLSLDYWQSWFKDYDKNLPLAIIHFTKFRYE